MIAQKLTSKEDMEFENFKYLTWERTFLWQEVSINRNISQTSYITNTHLCKNSNLQIPKLTMNHYILIIFWQTLFSQMILNIHIRMLYFPILTLYTVTKCAICWRGKLSFVSPAFCRKFDVTVNYIVQKVGGERGK